MNSPFNFFTLRRKGRIAYADDDTGSVNLLLRLRLPPLVIGLVLGIVISLIASRFEEVLLNHIQVAYFLPFIVYVGDAIGTQTEAIYSRDLKTGKAHFHHYLIKESMVGLFVGALFGVVSSGVVKWWLNNDMLALSVGLSMFIVVATAPLVALITTEAMRLFREDPATGAGPIATVIQDMLSVLIYGMVCSAILL